MSASVPDATPIPLGNYTFQTTFGEALFYNCPPAMQTLHGAWYCDAIGAMADPWWTMVQDVGTDDGTPTVGTYLDGAIVTDGYQPGYGEIFNPLTVPLIAAAYLGQFVGVALPNGVDLATARSLIGMEWGFHRATDDAIIAAAKRNLTGTRSVQLIRRTYVDGTPNGFWFGLVVRPEELTVSPTWNGETGTWAGTSGEWEAGDGLDALTAAVNAAKMSGMMWWLVRSDDYIWSGATHTWSADAMSWAQTSYEQP